MDRMNARWIEIKYCCNCMQDEVSLQSQERGKHERVDEFVERLRDQVSEDHQKRSPLCMADSMKYVKIPVAHDGAIGEATGGRA
jgi:hypothetical protein